MRRFAAAFLALLCPVAGWGKDAAKIMLFDRGDGKWTQRFEITQAQEAALPEWSPYDHKPIPLSLQDAMAQARKKTAAEPVAPLITDISLSHGRDEETDSIWYYEIYATEENKARHIWNDCHIVVLMDGTVLVQTSPLNQ